MTESKRVTRVHRLRSLWQDSRMVSGVLLICGLACAVPLLVLLFANDIERTANWIALMALPVVFFFVTGGIMWRYGVKEAREKILNRDF